MRAVSRRVSERIKYFLEANFPEVAEHLDDNDELLESGILDSLRVLKLVSFVEHEFLLRMSDKELVPENFRTIACLASFVLRGSHSNAGQQR